MPWLLPVMFPSALLGAVPQAHMDSRPVRLPVVDGTDIRFARLSTADGLS